MDAKKLETQMPELKTATIWTDAFDKNIPPLAFALNQYETRRFYCFTKRIFDISVALLALTLLSPVLIVTAILIRLESKGPVFFTQKRVGRGLLFFNIIKFRTMFDGTPETALMVEDPATGEMRRPRVGEDPRLTRVGRFLRVFSIDELPQLFNILHGDMSFIGPRPLTVEESLAIPRDALCRYFVSPGLSGLAQIKNRAAIHGVDRFDSDIEYVRSRSFLLDLKLFVLSFARFYHLH